MNKYVITREIIKGQEYMISALYDENKKMIEALPEPAHQQSILGNIYIARVENIVQNLNAAFVKISPEEKCYLPLEELKHPIFTKKISAKKDLVAGDELLVQVSRESLKTKEPAVTANLNFVGKYAILTTGNRRLSVSSKLPEDARAHYLELLDEWRRTTASSEEAVCGMEGIIIRTNAAAVTDTEVLAELNELKTRCSAALETAKYKTCYSLIYQPPATHFKHLDDLRQDQLKEIVTDDRSVFEELCTHYRIPKENLMTKGSVSVPVNQIDTSEGIRLRYYDDAALSLSALYSVNSCLEDALKPRVWLKSGAYLIIEPTEALTVIDVNTGKNITKKDVQAHFLKVNQEAAVEIARQLRLRNISGMILIDFINLTEKAAEKELLATFRKELKRDPVPTQLIDMTKLGLVEVTRKKVYRSLHESLSQI